jgi:hypothetical protein
MKMSLASCVVTFKKQTYHCFPFTKSENRKAEQVLPGGGGVGTIVWGEMGKG